LAAVRAKTYFLGRQYDRAIELCRQTLAVAPNASDIYFWLGRSYEAKSMLPEAIDALEKSRSLRARSQGRGFGTLAATYARAGRKEEARKLLKEMMDYSETAYVAGTSVALIHIGFGDLDRAMDWLEKAYADRDFSLTAIEVEPAYDALRSRPRFHQLVSRLRPPGRYTRRGDDFPEVGSPRRLVSTPINDLQVASPHWTLLEPLHKSPADRTERILVFTTGSD
jgi:pentatricopeptide repeat protein